MRPLTKRDIALIRGGSGSVGDPLVQAYFYYDEATTFISIEESDRMALTLDLIGNQAMEAWDLANGNLEAALGDEVNIDRDLVEIGEDSDNIAQNQAVQAYWAGVIESLTGG
jgi:hypothetical protein